MTRITLPRQRRSVRLCEAQNSSVKTAMLMVEKLTLLLRTTIILYVFILSHKLFEAFSDSVARPVLRVMHFQNGMA